jgi:uncharacterized membrane protein YfcA
VTYSVAHLVFVAAVVCAAATVKGTVGFGFPLIAIPVLTAAFGPRFAIPVVVPATLISNVILISRGGGRGAGSAAPFVATIAALVVGTVGGALLMHGLNAGTLEILVGAMSLLYVVVTVFRLSERVPPIAGRRAAPLVGLATGLLGGSTGIFSPILASYLHMLRLDKRAFVYWITLLFFVSNIVQAVTYYRLGLYGGSVLGTAVFACLPMAVGTWLGLVLQDRLHPEVFARVVLGLVCITSLNLIIAGTVGHGWRL